MMKGKMLIVSAPSGSGKSTIVNWLMREHPELRLYFSISCTSRAPRGTEQNGVEYFFLTPEEFRQSEKMPLTVVLDDVRSMHNVGSVLRTADAFRVEEVVLCGITGCPPHPEIHKTALGAEDSVSWRHVDNVLDAVSELKALGMIVLSVEQAEGSEMLPLFQAEQGKHYAIVLGNEVKGVHQEVIDVSDGCLEIPQLGTKHSLNVSVTAGIVIYQFAQQLILG